MAEQHFPGVPPGFQAMVRNQLRALMGRVEKLEKRVEQAEQKPPAPRRGRKPKGDVVDG